MEPKIIYEDQSLIVIDKPVNMVVNKSETTKRNTVQEWVESQFKVQSASLARRESRRAMFKVEEDSEFLKRGGIVHRLDKETSGLLIIAKNEESFRNLQAQFKEGRVKKVYQALVHGKVTPSEGSVNVPIGRLPWNRMRFGVIPEGRESITRYRAISNYPGEDLTFLEAYPETGRTHQIRVHMKYIGHSIFADELYAGRKAAKRDRKLLPRHFLHAAKISFNHPRSHKKMELESPLPPDLQEFLSTLT